MADCQEIRLFLLLRFPLGDDQRIVAIPMAFLFVLLALLLVITACVHVAQRRSGRSSMLLSLGSVSTRWLTDHRSEQQ